MSSVLALALTVASLSASGPASAQQTTGTVVEVKFRQGLRVELRGGQPVLINGAALAGVAAVNTLSGSVWSRSHAASNAALTRLQLSAAANGQSVPDLALYYRVTLPPGRDTAQAAAALQRLPSVEAAYVVPEAAPAPLPPDFSDPPAPYQRYLDEAPAGIGARSAWERQAGSASGVRICDIEYSWNAAHLDLPAVTLLGDQPFDPFASDHHGTAVLGILGARENGFGVTGIAHDATFFFAAAFPASSGAPNIGAAVTTCAAALRPGDIIVIEQQMFGPNSKDRSSCQGCVPVEWYKPTYDAIRIAIGAGITVVEAGANGGENLDDVSYSSGNDGHYPFLAENDSGALIIGAGRAPSAAADQVRSRLGFSNYGSTFDLQGWGESVVTTGYGDRYALEGRNLLYTAGFGGTSSATPIVAGAAAIVQSAYRARFDAPARPALVKRLLRATGTPQRGTTIIGPLPDLSCAIDSLLPLQLKAPANAAIGASVVLEASVGALDATVPVTYTWELSGQPPVTHSGGATDRLEVSWDTLGEQSISVRAQRGCGIAATEATTITIRGLPLQALTLDGPKRLLAGATAIFTATAGPSSATPPIRYTWRTDGGAALRHTNGLSDSVALNWESAGIHTITVTADNAWGPAVSTTHTVVVGVPLRSAILEGPPIALSARSARYQVTVDQPSATTPITYTWQVDNQPPISHTSALSDSLTITWDTPGTRQLRVTIDNGWGTPITLTQLVAVRRHSIFIPFITR